MDKEKINNEGVKHGLVVFKNNKKYSGYAFYDNFLTQQFNKLTPDLDKNHVIMLLACIDSFGHTHCKSIKEYAEVICDESTDFLNRVKRGDESLVMEIIAKSVEKYGKVQKNTSILSKFCCKCNESKYPISDSLVREFLIEQNENEPFGKGKISKTKLRTNYNFFFDVINKFIKSKHGGIRPI